MPRCVVTFLLRVRLLGYCRFVLKSDELCFRCEQRLRGAWGSLGSGVLADCVQVLEQERDEGYFREVEVCTGLFFIEEVRQGSKHLFYSTRLSLFPNLK